MTLFLKKIKPSRPLTVGIAAYNEAGSINKAINSLKNQLAADDEIIVVTSGCTDGTTEVVESMNDARIQLINQDQRRGKADAQNQILAAAHHEIIVFCDADVITAPGAIANLKKHFSDDKVAAVCAYETGLQRKSFFDKVQFVGYWGLHEQKLKEQRQGKFWSLNGHLFALRKSYAPHLDVTNLVEDAWLGFYLKKRGYRLVYEPRAQVWLNPAQNLRDYLRQKVRIRTGWLQMQKQGMPLRQKRSLAQLFKFFIFDPYTVPFVFFEAISWLQAYSRFRRHKFVWEKVESGKI